MGGTNGVAVLPGGGGSKTSISGKMDVPGIQNDLFYPLLKLGL